MTSALVQSPPALRERTLCNDRLVAMRAFASARRARSRCRPLPMCRKARIHIWASAASGSTTQWAKRQALGGPRGSPRATVHFLFGSSLNNVIHQRKSSYKPSGKRRELSTPPVGANSGLGAASSAVATRPGSLPSLDGGYAARAESESLATPSALPHLTPGSVANPY
ncbi:hypothetical protein C8R47DRAFT_1067638 [Mycena vitilis]|nr:hypothetical protein C8R47DRAFT_1067638 [Mycena vitilis]